LQEIRRRAEYLDLQADRSEQASQSLAQRDVIVDYKYNRLLLDAGVHQLRLDSEPLQQLLRLRNEGVRNRLCGNAGSRQV
jgi:hypothetical protein